MSILVGQIYRCQNPHCRSEMKVVKPSGTVGGKNPRCCCGAEMKKPYTPPVLRELPSEVRVFADDGTEEA
jgi:hypothetical protein